MPGSARSQALAQIPALALIQALNLIQVRSRLILNTQS
jgi:hypothetical protein